MTGLIEAFIIFGRDFEVGRPQQPRGTRSDLGNEDLQNILPD